MISTIVALVDVLYRFVMFTLGDYWFKFHTHQS